MLTKLQVTEKEEFPVFSVSGNRHTSLLLNSPRRCRVTMNQNHQKTPGGEQPMDPGAVVFWSSLEAAEDPEVAVLRAFRLLRKAAVFQ